MVPTPRPKLWQRHGAGCPEGCMRALQHNMLQSGRSLWQHDARQTEEKLWVVGKTNLCADAPCCTPTTAEQHKSNSQPSADKFCFAAYRSRFLLCCVEVNTKSPALAYLMPTVR